MQFKDDPQTRNHNHYLDLSEWRTPSLVDISSCFKNSVCIEMDLSNWDVSHVLDARECFATDTLVALDISNWVFNDKCNFNDIFKGCDNLTVMYCKKKTFKRLHEYLPNSEEWTYVNHVARK